MHIEYLYLLLYIIISLIIPCLILLFSYILVYQKIKSYECGFQPFDDNRQKFDIRFYLVSLLFVIFDLEIMFLFPWVISLSSINFLGFINMFIFLLILIIGFIYEWTNGALDWE